MQPSRDNFMKRALPAMALLALAIVFSFIALKAHYTPEILQLRFNPYALLSGVAFVGSIGLLAVMIHTHAPSEELTWFMLVITGHILFAGGEMMQLLNATQVGSVFWSEFGGFGVLLIPVGLFLFAISYTRQNHTPPGFIVPVMIAGTSLVSLFFAEGNLIFDNIPAHTQVFPWGINNLPGPAFYLSIGWIFLPSIMAIILLLRFGTRTKNLLLKRQSLLYALAIGIPIFSGVVTDGVLPALNINVLPPLATVFELSSIIAIFYGISHYQFFQINPAILADNVLKTMSEAVVVARPDFVIEFMNVQAERLFGVSTDTTTSRSITDLFTPESWATIQGTDVETGHEEFNEVTAITHDGTQLPVQVTSSVLSEGKDYQALIFVIADISDLADSYNRLESDATRIRTLLDASHLLEKQLAAEKAGVEHTVEVRTQELREAQVRLQESDKLKTEFIMLGSHNLRTPITIMASSMEMLKATHDDGERAMFLDSLDHGVKQMRDFVEDMVTISSLEAGADLNRQPIAMDQLLAPLVSDFNALAKAKTNLACTVEISDGELQIAANATRLQGAIRNLITNSFKFTSTGSIRFSAHKQDSNYVISVTDTGIGISEDERTKVFTMFHRGTDTLKFEYEGKGIGLYLVKLIVEQHGGTVSVESTEGKGSTFSISLPVQA
jgi:PAS domain S-box-containing protein